MLNNHNTPESEQDVVGNPFNPTNALQPSFEYTPPTKGDIAGVNSLGYIVFAALADLNLPSTNFFPQFLHWAIQGYRELNIVGLMPTTKVIQLPVNQKTNTVCLPKDFIDFYRIGVNCHGIFINLDMNDELILKGDARVDLCPCDSKTISQSVNAICNCALNNWNEAWAQWGGWQWGNFDNGYANYDWPNFGIGPGYFHGGYRINREQNIIQFDTCLEPKTFYMEYKSSGITCDGNAIIPQDAIPCLLAYLHWKRCTFSVNPNDNRQAQTFRREMLVLKQDLECRQDALTRYDYLDIFRRFTFQQVKC